MSGIVFESWFFKLWDVAGFNCGALHGLYRTSLAMMSYYPCRRHMKMTLRDARILHDLNPQRRLSRWSNNPERQNAISDNVGAFNTLNPLATMTGALVFVMFAATTPGAVIVFAILYGVFFGGFVAMVPPTLASTARSPDEIGIWIGSGYCFCSLAMLTGSPISGALLGPNNDWAKPIVFSREQHV
ncbi:uncharacterized protein C8Q71DRAFT_856763 [Rhodofomes roseus]|uniref:Major facilitator superfamily (MFS) profile domain-containing protein n=1 Tax=Rhodofomes roseus TaxID=34475 RepID=A0ABQ8KHW8_9APHY|nr:uncharacterized protein C8Q71DRAFT_856763 [Rhodofomes roseus]KAH9837561.1 hypothetical protein C8Q71DRAFT_856763 [Rhodofomes roseus]